MNWIPLTSETQLEQIRQQSATRPQLIFKHSTRCSISSMVRSRLEKSAPLLHIDFYCLDLIAYRSISGLVAETFQVYHESPQVLLIRNGECIYEESHNGICMEDIAEQVPDAA